MILEEQQTSLWIDINQGKYFLIPNEYTFLDGDTVLVSLKGTLQQVDSEALSNWEITADQFELYITNKAVAFLPHIQAGINGFLSSLNNQGETESSSPPTEPQLQQTAQFFGVTPDMLQTSLAQVGLNKMVTIFANFLTNCISEDALQFQLAKKRVQSFRKDLQKNNIEVTDSIESLPEKIQYWYHVSDNKDEFHQLIESLRDFAVQIQDSPANHLNLNQVIRNFGDTLHNLFEDDTVEKRMARYRDKARQAIGTKTPTFDFKTVWAEYNQEKANRLIKQGNHFFDKKMYEKAIVAYKEAIRVYPDYQAYTFIIGECFLKLERFEEAMQAYHETIEHTPGHDQAWNGLGQCLMLQGRDKEAIQAFEEAININVEYSESLYYGAMVYTKLGNSGKAKDFLQRSLAIHPDWALYAKQNPLLKPYLSARNKSS